jgi:hypothetical protein
MEIYRFSYVDIYYTDRAADFDVDCIVEISRDRISLKYDDENRNAYVWSGKSKGSGHYELEANQDNCRATLHRIQDSVYLEGFWQESGHKGMWRVRLSDKFLPGK